jgi:hypothetical protein
MRTVNGKRYAADCLWSSSCSFVQWNYAIRCDALRCDEMGDAPNRADFDVVIGN